MPGVLDADSLWRVIDVGRGVLAELDEEVILDRVLETAQQLTGARYAAIGVLDEDRRELARFVTRGIDGAGRAAIGDLPRGRGVLGVLIRQPEPLRVTDVGSHPQSFGFPPGHPPMSSFLGVPILIGGHAWGNLYLTEKQDADEFDQSDEDAVVLLASWASIAIEHARLHRTSETRGHELEQAVRRLRATNEVAMAVGGEPDLERVLELVVKRGRALVDATSLLALLVDGDDLVVAASAGRAERLVGRRIKLRESTSGAVLRRGYAERIEDVQARMHVPPEELGVDGATAALLVPMLHRAAPVGVLAAFNQEGGTAFSKEQEESLRIFATSAALAIASAQELAGRRLQTAIAAAEEERRRWARELHDQTLQTLGALRVILAGARRHGDLDTWKQAGEEAIEQIEHEIGNLRAIVADLRPPALDEFGLATAIEALCERQQAAAGLQIECIIAPATISLSSELELTVYRLVQEALTNIVKHAGATHARVAIEATPDEVCVLVSDDGGGFDVNSPASGFGLSGAQERVALASGMLEIESGGEGTTIRACIPTGGVAALQRAT